MGTVGIPPVFLSVHDSCWVQNITNCSGSMGLCVYSTQHDVTTTEEKIELQPLYDVYNGIYLIRLPCRQHMCIRSALEYHVQGTEQQVHIVFHLLLRFLQRDASFYVIST